MIAVVVGAVLASATLLAPWRWPPGDVAAALYLFCFAPGHLLVGAWLRDATTVERPALAVGASLALSVFVVYGLQFLPGSPTAALLVVGIDAAIGLLALAATRAAASIGTAPASEDPAAPTARSGGLRRDLVGIALVVALAAFLRLAGLGFAEFQDDEIDVMQAAVALVFDSPRTMFSNVRGPAQSLITAVFFLSADRYDEWVPRAPVALASLATVLAVIALGRRSLGRRAGLLAGLLLSVEGFVLAYGRIVQMQATLLLMMALTVLAFLCAAGTADPVERWRWRALGAVLFAAGLLAHHEMMLMGPVLAYQCLPQRSGVRLPGRGRPAAIGSGAGRAAGVARALAVPGIAVALAAAFFVPFVLDPHFAETSGYYGGAVVGSGVVNNLRTLALVGTFYNAPHYWIGLYALLVMTWVRAVAREADRRPAALAVGLALTAGAATVIAASALGRHVDGRVGLALLAALALLLARARRLTAEARAIHVWFFVFFLPYAFYLKILHVHYYVLSIPLVLLAADTLQVLWVRARIALCARGGAAAGAAAGARAGAGAAGARMGWRHVPWRAPTVALLALVAAVWFAGAVGYAWLAFVRSGPEYALTYPASRPTWLPTTSDAREGEAFGFPHNSGWKVVGRLYRAGVLRGGYETNELHHKAVWYTRRQARDDQPPRYYFVAEVPHRLQAGPWPEPFDAERYRPIGVVTVGGRTRLRLYELGDPSSGGPPAVYPLEEHAEAYDRARTPSADRFLRRWQADDQYFLQAARRLEAIGSPGDAVALVAGEQRGILCTYYRGSLPVLALSSPGDPADGDVTRALEELRSDGGLRRVHGLLWAVAERDPERRVERRLAEAFFPAEVTAIGNIAWRTYVSAGEPWPSGPRNSNGARLGDGIVLVGHTLPLGPASAGGSLPFSLFWRVDAPVAVRSKVFAHLVDPADRLVAQQDGEPVADTRPTDGWAPGETVLDNHALTLPTDLSAGSYRLLVGLYDPVTGARPRCTDAHGRMIPDGRVPLGAVVVTSASSRDQ